MTSKKIKKLKKPLSTFSLSFLSLDDDIKNSIKKPLEEPELIPNIRNEFEDAVDRLLKNVYKI